jgi:hypothetical protein
MAKMQGKSLMQIKKGIYVDQQEVLKMIAQRQMICKT